MASLIFHFYFYFLISIVRRVSYHFKRLAGFDLINTIKKNLKFENREIDFFNIGRTNQFFLLETYLSYGNYDSRSRN